jgi:hypothetical protein
LGRLQLHEGGDAGTDLNAARILIGREHALVGSPCARKTLRDDLAGLVFIPVERTVPPQRPAGEQAIEGRLDQGRPEERLALWPLEGDS